jgi:CBS domain-containing protein
MQAADIMTTNVVSVGPETSVQEIASLLSERGISGVPVVDGKRQLVGMISEGDLMRRVETGTQLRRSWWLEMLSTNTELASEYVKTRGRRARHVMTPDVVSITEATSLAEIADLLERHRIKRVPVVRDGILVGIVSRANLVRALASSGGQTTGAGTDRDDVIRDRLLAELKRQKWAEASPGNVIVTDGVVHLWGTILSEEERQALRVAAENIAGVRGVQDHTTLMPSLPPV